MIDLENERLFQRIADRAPKRRDFVPAPSRVVKVKPANNGRFHIWRGQQKPDCAIHGETKWSCRDCFRKYKREWYRRMVTQ